MNDDQMLELARTGRTYVSFDFGADLAELIYTICERADDIDIAPKVHLSGSNVLLVINPDHDPDGEEG